MNHGLHLLRNTPGRNRKIGGCMHLYTKIHYREMLRSLQCWTLSHCGNGNNCSFLSDHERLAPKTKAVPQRNASKLVFSWEKLTWLQTDWEKKYSSLCGSIFFPFNYKKMFLFHLFRLYSGLYL